MPTVYIDGTAHEVEKGRNMLDVALSLGYDLPYFCWHPAMDSIGACRQCAVIQYKDEKDTKGKIQMACMLAADDGVRISINAKEAREFRAQVIEWLMVNHPHDCPICDEGGECHLQDMTVMTGHNYRKYRFKKRTHRNQDLGPFINHEMNRCIVCYRCTRFYHDFAGGRDFNVHGAHDHAYFGRYEDGILESEFSGNLVEVCPTGVFTDKTLKQHYARKWDLQSGPSVCQHCGLGCNTLAGSRYDKIVRTLNRYNRQVNGYFICDRGRFGYEFVNSEKRILGPTRRSNKNGEVEKAEVEQTVSDIAKLLSQKEKVVGIGSPRASLESNFALRTLVGPDNFYSGTVAHDSNLVKRVVEILRNGPARSASLHDVEKSDAVLVLGEDLTNTAPMLDLAIRQATRNEPNKRAVQHGVPAFYDAALRDFMQKKRGPLYVATPVYTKLDEIATSTYRATAEDIARLGYAVAHAIDPSSPDVDGIPDDVKRLAEEIAGKLKGAENPVVISGTSMRSDQILQAAANVAWALAAQDRPANICYTVPECNSVGISLFGGHELEKAFDKLTSGQADTVVILENDLYRRAGSAAVDKFLQAAKTVIVIDHLQNQTTSKADYVLPAATFAEGDGTIVSNEGRVQRYFQAISPDPVIKESWRWIRDLMLKNDASKTIGWNTLDDIYTAVFTSLPSLAEGPKIVPDASFRIAGLKIARSPARYSGRTAMNANKDVNEPKPPDDPDSPLSFSMEGYQGVPPGGLIPFFWSPGWNSVQATAKYQSEVGGPLRGGDPGYRLIEPKKDGKPDFFSDIPKAFSPKSDQLLAVPVYHIYGSEELSAQGKAVGTLVPSAYVGLSPETLAQLKVEPGTDLSVTVGGRQYRLPCKVVAGLPEGTAGLPPGLPDLTGLALPVWIRVESGGQS